MNTATELSRPGLSPTVPMPRIRAEPLASRAGRGNEQRRGELVELADVGRAGILHFVAADRGDRDRNVLQDLAAALGGDDDLVGLGVGRGLRLRFDGRLLGRRRLGSGSGSWLVS